MTGGDDDTISSGSSIAEQTEPIDELVADRYQIVRWLGGGGMGRVYAAVDTELDERVALKVLRGGLSDDAIERFRREVRLTRRIQHNNVARMFDIGEHAGNKFLTMELVDGVPLSQLISPPMKWERLRAIALQLCEGLGAAHTANVVHRDLKPDNILVETGSDRVVITDFGIARGFDDAAVTQLGAVVGTPRYMAPEQLAGAEVDARSDLFSLGVILYELASGGRPWHGDNAITIAVAQATEPPRAFTAEHLPPWFVDLVLRCLHLEPAQRPQTASELAEAIASGASPLTLRDVTAPTRAQRPSRAPITTPTATPVAETTIAVLPVACAPGDEYLADGLLDDLIDTLSATAGLRVRPAGLVRSVDEPDPRELGKRLEVDHVVAVSLRRLPNGLRLSGRLLSVGDGFQIWAHRVDCSEAQILAVSDSLGRGIATALSTRATAATKPTDPRSVDLYLRARAELRRYWGSHAVTAADLLDKAAELAPTSPPILGAAAFASAQAWVLRGTPSLAPRARDAIERGLATGHGEAYLASAIYKLNRGDGEGGARDLGLALVRAPMSAHTHEAAGRILMEVDDHGEAEHHFETAIGLDPGRVQVVAAELARLDALRGDFGRADERVARLLADPDASIMQLGSACEARLAGWRGRRDIMLAATERFGGRMGPDSENIIKFLTAYANKPTEDDAWRRLVELYRGTDRPTRQTLLGMQLLAEVALMLDHPMLAWETLGQAEMLGLMDVVWMDHCPLFVRYAGDHGYRDVRDRVAERARRVLAAFRS